MGNSLKLSKQPPPISVDAENANLRVFSYKELKKATKKFEHEIMVNGRNGDARTFYKGYLNETTLAPSRTGTGLAVSVTKCSPEAIQELKEEVNSIGQISHPNLVKLLGYCCEDNRTFFVSEHLDKGSLDCHIFGRKASLPWELRIKIAIGIAQGLAFLQSMRKRPIHQELRMHNIMLDKQYNAKLYHLESYLKDTSQVMVDQDQVYYMAPEYCEAGDRGLGKEANVYAFGVFLLELLTGSKVKGKFVDKQGSNVWNRYFLPDIYKIGKIADPQLGDNYPVNAATQMITLIRRCTKTSMNKRPLMQEVLDTLNYIAEIKH